MELLPPHGVQTNMLRSHRAALVGFVGVIGCGGAVADTPAEPTIAPAPVSVTVVEVLSDDTALLQEVSETPALPTAEKNQVARIGARAPALNARRLTGSGPVSLRQARNRVVVLEFWATYCAPCRRSLPATQKLVDKYRGKVAAIGVNVDGTDVADAAIRLFAQQQGARYAMVRDPGLAISDRYVPTHMPTTYIIDRAGIVRFVHRGYHTGVAQQIERQVAQLLGLRTTP